MLVIETKSTRKARYSPHHVLPCVRVRYIQRKVALAGECCKICYRRTLSGLHRGDGVRIHSPPLDSLFFIPPKPCFCHCPKVKSWKVVRGASSLGDRGGATGNGRHVVAQSNRSESAHNPFKAQRQVLMNPRRHPETQATRRELRRLHGLVASNTSDRGSNISIESTDLD
jgi:hypothetical protein